MCEKVGRFCTVHLVSWTELSLTNAIWKFDMIEYITLKNLAKLCLDLSYFVPKPYIILAFKW